MTKRSLAAIFAVFALFVNLASAQSVKEAPANQEEPKLSAAEEAEARALVDHYCARLAETNSIGPLLDEFHTSDVVEQFKQKMAHEFDDDSADEETEANSVHEAETRLKLDDSVWRRFFVDMIDTFYLMMLSAWNHEANGEESKFTDWISPRAQAKMRTNVHLADLLDDIEDGPKFADAHDFTEFLDTLEAAETIMRDDLSGTTPALLTAIRFLGEEPRAEELQLRVRVLTAPEYERPAGTRVIQINLPIGVTLNLVRENGELRFLLPELPD